MKYKLTTNTKKFNGVTLYQIQALKDFRNVKKDDLGGWIEKEENLSQNGDCWVNGNAIVNGNARVNGYAQVSGDAIVDGYAWLGGNVHVSGNAVVSGDAWVGGNVHVSGNAIVSGNAWLGGNAHVSGNAVVSGDAQDIPDILSTLPKEVSSVTISGKTYKLETKWVLQD